MDDQEIFAFNNVIMRITKKELSDLLLGDGFDEIAESFYAKNAVGSRYCLFTDWEGSHDRALGKPEGLIRSGIYVCSDDQRVPVGEPFELSFEGAHAAIEKLKELSSVERTVTILENEVLSDE